MFSSAPLCWTELVQQFFSPSSLLSISSFSCSHFLPQQSGNMCRFSVFLVWRRMEKRKAAGIFVHLDLASKFPRLCSPFIGLFHSMEVLALANAVARLVSLAWNLKSTFALEALCHGVCPGAFLKTSNQFLFWNVDLHSFIDCQLLWFNTHL